MMVLDAVAGNNRAGAITTSEAVDGHRHRSALDQRQNLFDLLARGPASPPHGNIGIGYATRTCFGGLRCPHLARHFQVDDQPTTHLLEIGYPGQTRLRSSIKLVAD